MLTTYPLDAPARKAIDPYFALPGYAVDGADLRVNATGGMKMLSSMLSTGIPFPASMTFVFGNEGLTFTTERHLWGSAGSGGGGSRCFMDANRNLFVFENGGSDVVSLGNVPAATKILRIDYDASAREFFAYADHVPIGLGARTPTDPMQPLIYICGAWAGGGAPINCDVLRMRFTNFIPTDDEAEGAAKGESRGRLAGRGYAITPAAFTGSWTGSGGFTSPGGGNTQSVLSPTFKSGDLIRIRYSATAANGICRLANASLAFVSADHATTSGVNDFELLATADGDRVYFDGFGGAVTVSVFTAQASGTVASCAPENCTSLNRWLDNSGNNYHLLPVGSAKALNPQVPHWRKYAFAVDTVTPAFGGSGLLPGFAGSKTGTGVAQVTFTNFGFDYALAANTHLQRKVGATGFCTSQMLGPGTAEFKFYDIAGTPADAYGNGEIEIFE